MSNLVKFNLKLMTANLTERELKKKKSLEAFMLT